MPTDRPAVRLVAALAVTVVIAAVLRARFVDLLTRTTGTWIGSPDRVGRR